MRVAITGRTVGPPMYESLELLGPRRDAAPAARVPGRPAVAVSDVWASTVPGAAVADRRSTGPSVACPVGPGRHDPWRRRCASWTRAVGARRCAAFVYYAITLYQVHATGQSDHAGPADAIVVMGAAQYDGTPSPLLQARLDHVVELWAQGLRATGRRHRRQPTRRPVHRGERVAGVPRRPRRARRRDPRGRRRPELVRIAGRAWPTCLTPEGCDRVLLVSDPFHSLRIKLTADELGLDAAVSPTRTSPVQGGQAVRREMKEAAGVALGRIIGFRRLLSITG